MSRFKQAAIRPVFNQKWIHQNLELACFSTNLSQTVYISSYLAQTKLYFFILDQHKKEVAGAANPAYIQNVICVSWRDVALPHTMGNLALLCSSFPKQVVVLNTIWCGQCPPASNVTLAIMYKQPTGAFFYKPENLFQYWKCTKWFPIWLCSHCSL